MKPGLLNAVIYILCFLPEAMNWFVMAGLLACTLLLVFPSLQTVTTDSSNA